MKTPKLDLDAIEALAKRTVQQARDAVVGGELSEGDPNCRCQPCWALRTLDLLAALRSPRAPEGAAERERDEAEAEVERLRAARLRLPFA